MKLDSGHVLNNILLFSRFCFNAEGEIILQWNHTGRTPGSEGFSFLLPFSLLEQQSSPCITAFVSARTDGLMRERQSDAPPAASGGEQKRDYTMQPNRGSDKRLVLVRLFQGFALFYTISALHILN